MKGYLGKLLKINLTTCEHEEIVLPEKTLKKYIGGRGLGAKLLYDMLKPGVDPLSEDNVFIVLTGPLTGTLAPGGSKYVVITKSPATGAFLDSYSSGIIAPEIKFAGYDGIALTGKAKEPSILKIYNKEVELISAKDIWGKDAFEAETKMKEMFNEKWGTMVIGPAGENLVKIASINSDYYRQAARGGGGAVLGSKNIKGIMVRGTNEIKINNVKQMLAMQEPAYKKLKDSQIGQVRMKYGTPFTLDITNSAGMLPTYNFQTGVFKGAEDFLGAEAVYDNIIADRACYGCMLACSKVVKAKKGEFIGEVVEGPEYETLGLLGSNLGIKDLSSVVLSNKLCDKLGLDTISVGNVIGFIMECYEKGLLKKEDIDGLEMEFGNSKNAHILIKKIAYREGIGNLLAEGVAAVAKKIKKGTEKFAMHSKKLEFPAYDPRAAFGAALAYAVSPRGACHRRAWPPAIEVLGNIPPFTVEGKAEIVKDMFDENTIYHSLLVCDFPGKFIPITIEDYSKYLEICTGFNFTEKDLYFIAERIETQIRLFNVREGFSRKDDSMPYRITNEPLPEGPPAGKIIGKENFEKMLTEYYSIRGWDESGIPKSETLKKYGIEVGDFLDV